jgi:Putative DNA-binding domain
MPSSPTCPSERWQQQLTAWITEPKAKLDSRDRPPTNVDIYRQGYRARLVATMSETVFAPLARHWGKQNCARLLAQFFGARPPRATLVLDAASALPSWVGQQRDVGPAWLGSFSELCVQQWELLHGPDVLSTQPDLGTTDPGDVFLADGVRVVFSPQTGLLHARWIGSDDVEAAPSGEGVMLVKQGHERITSLLVPTKMRGFVHTLLFGESLAVACLALDAVEPADLTSYVVRLASRGALVAAPPRK